MRHGKEVSKMYRYAQRLISHMKKMDNNNKCRKLLKKGVIVVNGGLLCILIVPFCVLFVIIDIVWLLTDGVIKKIDSL